jgi:hypothetical protein
MAAAALAAAMSLASACGSARPTSALSGQAQPARTGAAVGQSSSRIAAQALDWYFPATAAQYAAGAQYQGEMLSLASQLMNACMARSGFHTPTESAATAAVPIWDLSQFPDFAQMRRTGLMVPDPRHTPATPPTAPLTAPPADRRQAYQADASRCQATVYAPFSRLQSAVTGLANAWIDRFTSIQGSARVRPTLAGFTSCVRRAGAPVGYAQNFNRFAVWAGGQIQGAASYPASLAADRLWGSVFARCGQPAETLFEKLQIPARAAFFQQHHRQITMLETLVGRTVTAASQQLAIATLPIVNRAMPS